MRRHTLVIIISAVLLSPLLYDCSVRTMLHASLVQMGTPVTNNVGDSRCHIVIGYGYG